MIEKFTIPPWTFLRALGRLIAHRLCLSSSPSLYPKMAPTNTKVAKLQALPLARLSLSVINQSAYVMMAPARRHEFVVSCAHHCETEKVNHELEGYLLNGAGATRKSKSKGARSED